MIDRAEFVRPHVLLLALCLGVVVAGCGRPAREHVCATVSGDGRQSRAFGLDVSAPGYDRRAGLIIVADYYKPHLMEYVFIDSDGDTVAHVPQGVFDIEEIRWPYR